MYPDIIKIRMKAALAKLPAKLVYRDQPITGTRSSIGKDPRFAEFGVLPGCKLSVVVMVDDFGTLSLPEAQDVLKVDGVDYRVLSSDVDPTGISVRISLGDLNG
jgi:hypothetical protein